jgi:hypothetical protein
MNFDNCQFINNLAAGFNGAAGAGGALLFSSDGSRTVRISNCYFAGNLATNIGACGGAILASRANLTIESSVFLNNTCNSTSAQGGGVFIDVSQYGNALPIINFNVKKLSKLCLRS